jgi:hypothetical protein
MGFLYADHRLRPAHGRFLAPLGLAVTAVLVALGPYPNSMVGLATDEFSNMDPPTLPIVALTIWEIGLALLLRAPVARWLERRRPWTAVVAINGVIMTAFLWHLTVMVLAIGILFPLGFPQPDVGTGSWWLWRPVWIACLLVLLSGFVALLGGVERSGLKRRTGAPPHPVSALLAVIGAVATLWGVLGFAIGGLHQVFSPTGDTLIVLQLNPFQNVIHIAWGVTLMAVADSPHATARRRARSWWQPPWPSPGPCSGRERHQCAGAEPGGGLAARRLRWWRCRHRRGMVAPDRGGDGLGRLDQGPATAAAISSLMSKLA